MHRHLLKQRQTRLSRSKQAPPPPQPPPSSCLVLVLEQEQEQELEPMLGLAWELVLGQGPQPSFRTVQPSRRAGQ
jgi:hypothetical protein